MRANESSKTDVDQYYEALINASHHKETLKNEEESKDLAVQINTSYLDKCKAIGKIGPLICKMNVKESFGNWSIRGNIEE